MLWETIARSLEFQKNYFGADLCYNKLQEDEKTDYENITLTYIILYKKTRKEYYLQKAEKYSRQIYDEEKRNELILKINLLEGKTPNYDDIFEEEIVESGAEEILLNEKLLEIYQIIKDIPLSSSKINRLKLVFGNKKDEQLKALYLNEIYNEIKTELKKKLSKKDIWIALIFLYIEGYNEKNKQKLENMIENKKINIAKLPFFTKNVVKQWLRKNKDKVNKITKLMLFKINKIYKAYKLVTKLKTTKQDINHAKKILNKINIHINESGKKFIVLLKRKLLKEIKDSANKILRLYGEKSKQAFLDKVFSKVNLEEEKEKII